MAKLSTRDIKSKIKGIKNTQRITNAMKSVSAAKLRKSQILLQATRPYSERLYELANHLALYVDRTAHPMLEIREEKNIDFIVITADRGLAGAFNSNVLKATFNKIKELEEEGKKVSVVAIGRKAVQFFKSRNFEVIQSYEDVYRDNLNLAFSSKVGELVASRYVNKKTDAIYLVNNESITTAHYETKIRKFFPLEAEIDLKKMGNVAQYNIEPTKEQVLGELCKRCINFQIYRALVESNTAEHAARMIAMDNATKNAGEAIKKWTIIFNKARQEAITTELIDIINAAEAIK